ncbi:CAP domain-containing protein, partial [Clostridium beijerinckii]|nr:CAP domain-containing protein [Clostridium beijerinckii]
MRKNGLRRIVTTVIAATTIGSFSSLGVSAATINSNVSDCNNVNINNFLNANSFMNTSNGNNVGNTDAVSKSGTNATSVNVQGLPNLPTNYSISIQNSAEDKILQLMNEKRKEAGLQPLTID